MEMSHGISPLCGNFENLGQRIQASPNPQEPSEQRLFHCIYFFLQQLPTMTHSAPKYEYADKEHIFNQLGTDIGCVHEGIRFWLWAEFYGTGARDQ
jgi:hypothetical protein